MEPEPRDFEDSTNRSVFGQCFSRVTPRNLVRGSLQRINWLPVSDAYSKSEQPPPPEKVGPYRIEERLGVGGMGEVFRAFDERLERWVAIKQILPSDTEDARARERLRREARAVASLNHPAIVQIHDIVETERGDWIVMEFVEGRTLQQLAGSGSLDMGQILRLGREIAEGLAEAHAKGIVHRDLKTENVMVTHDGHAKILDFGLAKRLWRHNKTEVSLSVDGSILGTGRAMSPEQVLGDEIDHRSDLFSLGTLLYESITGQRPFAGMSLIMTLAQVCTEKQLPAIEVNPEIPQDLSDLVERLLEKDPGSRPQSAHEVAAQLDRIAGGLPHDIALPSPVPDPVASSPSSLSNTRQILRSPSSSRSGLTESTAGIFIKTLLQISLFDLRRLSEILGSSRAYDAITRHDRLARDLLSELAGLEINKVDGFLLLFERPVDAVQYALAYHQKLAELSAEIGAEMQARIGIHLGEVFLRENTPEDIHRGAKPLEVEGLAKLVVSRVSGLAGPTRTLLTQEAYDLARRAMADPQFEGAKVYWFGHGFYRFQGVEEPARIFEMAGTPIEPVIPPQDTDRARRLGETDKPSTLPRSKVLAVLLAVVALFLAALLPRFWPDRPPSDSPTSLTPGGEARPSVAVLGFKNLSGRPEANWLSTALAEIFATELAAGEQIRMIAGENIARMKRDIEVDIETTLASDTLLDIREILGTDFVILGSYLSLEQEGDNRLRLQLRLQDTQRGDTIASVQETGAESELFELVSRAARDLRDKLGVSEISTVQAKEVRATMPSRPEALRLYSEGLTALRGFDFRGAREHFEQAVEVDDEYALAYSSLSQAWLELGYVNKAEEMARKALQLAENPDLPREERLQIQGNAFAVSEKWMAAAQVYTELAELFTDNVDYGLRLAAARTSAGQLDAAAETIAALRRLPEPGRNDMRIDLADLRLVSARGDQEQVVARASELLERRRSEEGGSNLLAEALRLQGFALFFLGRNLEALPVLEEARKLFAEAENTGMLGDILTSLGYIRYYQRNLPLAEEIYTEAAAKYEKIGVEHKISGIKHLLAVVYQLRGDLMKADKVLREAVETAREIGNRSREGRYLEPLADGLIQMGRLEEARVLAEEILEIGRESRETVHLTQGALALGRIELVAGNLPRSLELHAEALSAAYQMEIDLERKVLLRSVLSGYGEALYHAGDLEAAQLRFQEYWKIHDEVGEHDRPTPMIVYHVFLLLELGRPAEAAEIAVRVLGEFERARTPDFEAKARAAYATVLLRQGEIDKAREILEPAVRYLDRSQSPSVQMEISIARSRLTAAEDSVDAALNELSRAQSQAERIGEVDLALAVRLAISEVELRNGRTGPNELLRLQELIHRAEERSFVVIARRARRLYQNL